MYLLNNWHKFVLVAMLVVGYAVGSNLYLRQDQIDKTEASMKQMHDGGKTVQAMQTRQQLEGTGYLLGWGLIGIFIGLIFIGDIRRLFTPKAVALFLLLPLLSGCRKPFEPVKLEVIESHEAAFLLPFTGDGKKQEASENEEYLKKNLVYAQQVQIPQQWVPKGHETWGWNGDWKDAALLIKVDCSPVTRVWTADKDSGTSNKNEAIWVMTADQVEFSTGWTCTARIASHDDAVKFLHNYPNGSLSKVMDSEIRGKIQTTFGLEVTDLPMETLRKAATPHINKTVKETTDIFKTKGITISNLGIDGGFVYKHKSIMDTLVRAFNAEQEKAIAISESAAQLERNKTVILESTGKADAILKTKKAEADGQKMLADAKFYELKTAGDNLEPYIQIKRLELQKELLQKWDGRYPLYFMGTGGQGPNMLLQVPGMDAQSVPKVEAKKKN